MGGSGETQHGNGDPDRVETAGNGDGDDAAGTGQHSRETRGPDIHAEANVAARQPASVNAAEGGSDVNDDEREPEMRQVEVEARVEELRKPEEEEPPDRISEEFTDHESPGLTI